MSYNYQKEWSDRTIILVFLVGVIGFLGFTVLGAASCDQYSCEQLGRQAGVETKWDFWSTCYVKINGKWIPKDAWREIEK